MLSLCVWSYGMWEMVRDILYVKLLYVKFFVCVREAAGGRGGGGEGARDTESKTRTPHKVVGNKIRLYRLWGLNYIVRQKWVGFT